MDQWKRTLERFSDKIVPSSTYATTWHRFQPATNSSDSIDGREISKVTAESLESVVLVERYPRSKIRLKSKSLLQKQEHDAQESLHPLSADAGIPMRDMIVGVASGKIEDTVVLDLDKAEDNYGQFDLQ